MFSCIECGWPVNDSAGKLCKGCGPVDIDQAELNEGALNGCMSRLLEARKDLEAAGAPKDIDFNDQVKWVTGRLNMMSAPTIADNEYF